MLTVFREMVDNNRPRAGEHPRCFPVFFFIILCHMLKHCGPLGHMPNFLFDHKDFLRSKPDDHP